jgi:RNA polymerase sigma-70 factor (ECF subfamily)
MTADDTFARLMARLRSGEDAAAREVFERFAGRLVALTRGRFNRLLARKVDPEDVVQSAFKSFFVRHRAGKLVVGDSDGLWNLLTLITLRNCADRAEAFLADRRHRP